MRLAWSSLRVAAVAAIVGNVLVWGKAMGLPVVVRIERTGGRGAGVFVEDDLVITAGHVLQPHPGPVDADDYVVVLGNGTRLDVKAVLCLKAWSNGFRSSADMGVLRLKSKRPSLVVTTRIDQQLANSQVTICGPSSDEYAGTITRVPSSSSFDMLSSSDLAFPRGVSGGPIVDGDSAVVGIATKSASTPQQNLLIGLPLLSETLQWLIAYCP